MPFSRRKDLLRMVQRVPLLRWRHLDENNYCQCHHRPVIGDPPVHHPSFTVITTPAVTPSAKRGVEVGNPGKPSPDQEPRSYPPNFPQDPECSTDSSLACMEKCLNWGWDFGTCDLRGRCRCTNTDSLPPTTLKERNRDPPAATAPAKRGIIGVGGSPGKAGSDPERRSFGEGGPECSPLVPDACLIKCKDEGYAYGVCDNRGRCRCIPFVDGGPIKKKTKARRARRVAAVSPPLPPTSTLTKRTPCLGDEGAFECDSDCRHRGYPSGFCAVEEVCYCRPSDPVDPLCSGALGVGACHKSCTETGHPGGGCDDGRCICQNLPIGTIPH